MARIASFAELGPRKHSVEPRQVAPSFVPHSGVGVTIRCGPWWFCRNHGNTLEKCSRLLTYFSPKRTFRVWTWAIPCFDRLAVEGDGSFVHGYVNRKSCGGGLPRFTFFAELGPRKRDVTTTPRRFPVLERSPLRLICFWCAETHAEWDAAVGWLALSFSPNWASKT